MNYFVFDRSKKIALQGIKKYQTTNQYIAFIYLKRINISKIAYHKPLIKQANHKYPKLLPHIAFIRYICTFLKTSNFMAHRLNTNKQFMVGNGILAFAVIFVVVIFVYMSLRLDKKKDEDRNFIETYTITLTKGFVGDSLSLMINDSVLVNKKITEEPFSIDVKRFAEQSALFIVDNKTEKLSLFELSERGGTYRFEKENEEVKQLSQK